MVRRAREGDPPALHDRVLTALTVLGTGFVAAPGNGALRARLEAGELAATDLHHQLLTLVHRLLFLFAAEDRGVTLDPSGTVARLRRDAASGRRGAGPRWRQVARALREVAHNGAPAGSDDVVWSSAALLDLERADLATSALQAGVRALASDTDGAPAGHAGTSGRELGSAYERLLELHPRVDATTATYRLDRAAGHARKISGSYFTPAPLVDALLDTALEPALSEALAAPDPEAALLDLTVVDPSCGAGAFLVAAAHRIAGRLAEVRARAGVPPEQAARGALRDVVGRCVYGVDVSPLAAELCRLALWLESLAPGQPLCRLDKRVKVGDALLGATPRLLAGGIPTAAFTRLRGDDPGVARRVRARNAAERAGGDQPPAPAATPPDADHARLVADTWCAAFVWSLAADGPEPPTQRHFLRLLADPGGLPPAVRAHVVDLARDHRFFHWHLEFPEVLGGGAGAAGQREHPPGPGGFTAVVGNPPWERVKLQEVEWFAGTAPEIATAPTAAARKALITGLPADRPALHSRYARDRRRADAHRHLLRASGRFPLCGRGDLNTYALFAELNRDLLSPAGRAGFIVPAGIATDRTTRSYFDALLRDRTLVSFSHFENRRSLFRGLNGSMVFALLTIAGSSTPRPAEFAFFLTAPAELREPGRSFPLTADDIALVNPNTRTSPVLRSRRDAGIVAGIHRRFAILRSDTGLGGNPWGLSLSTMFHMSDDSGLFRTADQLRSGGWALDGNVFRRGEERCLPLYEAKLLHQYDHRWATDDGTGRVRPVSDADKQRPATVVLPSRWIAEAEVLARSATAGAPPRPWSIAWRGITRNSNERTLIATVLPAVAVGNSAPQASLATGATEALAFLANVCSLPLDYVTRAKVAGANLNFFVLCQLPVLAPSAFAAAAPWAPDETVADWLAPRVAELVYTAWDLQPFAADAGFDGPPFRWDPARRRLLRADIDAAFFQLYGLERHDVAHVLGTFPTLRRREVAACGEYRTARLVLERYDAMAAGAPWRGPTGPAPGDAAQRHLG